MSERGNSVRGQRRAGPDHAQPAEGAERADARHDPGDGKGPARVGEGSRDQGRGAARRRRPRLLRRRRRDGPLSRDARQSVGHPAPRLLSRRVYRQPPHLSLRQAVDLADRRHRHGRRRGPLGARLALGGEREVPVRHAGDHDRPLPRCRRRLFPHPPVGRAGHVPGAHQPSAEGGGRVVGRHRRCPCAERRHQRPAGSPRRGRPVGPRRRPQGRSRDRGLRQGSRHADPA